MKRIILVLCLCCTLATAGDLGPVTWYDAASNAVQVAEYRANQFPKLKVKEQHILVIAPAASWAVKLKETAIRAAATDMLNGKTEVTSNACAAVSVTTADAGIKFIPCDDPLAMLAKLGLKPPADKLEGEIVKPKETP